MAYPFQPDDLPPEAERAEMVDQQARADAYHRNLIAMLWGTRCEYLAEIKRAGGETLSAAHIRNRLRSILTTIETVEAGDYHTNCEACGKPLITGQMVITYEDAGDIHVDCEDPEMAKDAPEAHAYDDGFSAGECAREIAAAKALLAAPEGED